MTEPARSPHVVVVGSGGRPYREYSFAALARRYRVSVVLPSAPTWQLPYVDAWAVADLDNPAAIARAVTDILGQDTDVGLLTWDETALEATARAAERLGLTHMSPEAAARCRDKYTTRQLTAQAGLPSVRWRMVHTAEEAVVAAEEVGYPAVVKPRALAGSLGVVLADNASEVREAYRIAAQSRFGNLPTGHGVLIEEFLDGPEVSIDSVVHDGTVRPIHFAKKRLGFPPYFEEVGHLVDASLDEPWVPAARDLVVRAHEALGVEWGVTHAEVRVTADGPRLVELNGRLGGDLIPLLGRLATGIDLVVAAAELSRGVVPSLTPTADRTAEVRFAYPSRDCVVGQIDLRHAATVPGIEHAAPLADPGMSLRLPPQSAVPRLAALVAVGMDEQACKQVLDKAEQVLLVDLAPLD